jgi:hypothetical protein
VGALKLIAAALAFAAIAPATARAQTQTVTSGPVTATLTGEGHLTIVREGVTAFAAPISDVVCDGCLLQGADDVRLIDFDGDGEREVQVVAVTGGEGCCTVSGIYSFNGIGYDETVRNWRSGFETEDLDRDGRTEIVTVDPRFGDAFPPPAVYRFLRQDGQPVLVDITRSFPAVIRRNAATAKRQIAKLGRRDPDARGVVSAYVADQFLLGRERTGLRELDRLVARRVVSPAFKRRLLRTLDRYGYR